MKTYILTQSKRRLTDLIIAGSVLLLILGLQSCGNNDEITDPIDNSTTGTEATANVELKFASASDLANNALLYVFNTTNQFQRKQLNVNKVGNKLTTNMAAGTWNLVLLSSDANIESSIKLPVFNEAMSTAKMWETPLDAGGNFLTKVPEELRYASFPNTGILANTTNYINNANLKRSVGMIRVILTHSGFGTIPAGQSTTDYIELQDVPTTLSWESKFLPNKTTPTVSSKPLRNYLKFDAAGKADTVNFIVPAHMGANAADVTSHRVKIKACMMLGGSPFIGKGATVIPSYPAPNQIVEVKLTFRGEPDALLDIKVKVKEWETELNQNENDWSL